MRLWHQDIISKLPTKQLVGQHRECAALRGNGWGKKHKTVDYVFTYHPIRLYFYHLLIIEEMRKRGYKPSQEWDSPFYRGKKCELYEDWYLTDALKDFNPEEIKNKIYVEHDNEYLRECLDNLEKKGVYI
jgi:uncharacterized protein (TIGR02328 family)